MMKLTRSLILFFLSCLLFFLVSSLMRSVFHAGNEIMGITSLVYAIGFFVVYDKIRKRGQ